jgi:hypothetical protein
MLKCLNDERISILTLTNTLRNIHSPIDLLEQKFGNHYEVIAVYRDRHERFISLYNHIIQRINDIDTITTNILKELTIDDILFFQSNDISNRFNERNKKESVIDRFILNNKLNNENTQIKVLLTTLFTPCAHYHLHYSKIKWFDFNKLHELEQWVSDKLGFEFKLDKINTSKHIQSKLILNDKFIEKYNSIFDRFDLPKINKTFL